MVVVLFIRSAILGCNMLSTTLSYVLVITLQELQFELYDGCSINITSGVDLTVTINDIHLCGTLS